MYLRAPGIMKVFIVSLLAILLDNRLCVIGRPAKDNCINGVLYPDPADCGAYFICSNGQLIRNVCPGGLNFNTTIQVCDWPASTPCAATSPPNDTSSTLPTAPSTATPNITSSTLPNSPPTSTPNTTSASPTAPATSTTPISTEAPGQHTYCPVDDHDYDIFLPNPECTRYYVCFEGIAYEQSCPDGFHFNQHLPACDFPESAKCVQNAAPEQPHAVTLPPVGSDSTASWSYPGGSIPIPIPIAKMSIVISAPIEKIVESCPSEDTDYDVFLPNPDCTKYYICFNGTPFEQACPLGLHWNKNISVCDYIDQANCVSNEAPEQPNAITLPPTSSTTNNSSVTTLEPGPTLPSDQTCPLVNPEYDVFLPHPDCSRYYICLDGTPIEQQCPGGLNWNKNLSVCDYVDGAKCVNNDAPEQPNAVTLAPTLPTTNNSSVTTSEPGPTLPSDQSCPSVNPEYDVFLSHPDCSRFYICLDGIPFEQQCPGDLNWNKKLSVCDYAADANCIGNDAPEQPNAVTLAPTPSTTNISTLSPEPTLPANQSCPSDNTGNNAFLPHPDCSKYYICLDGVPIEQQCPGGLNWNKQLSGCDFEDDAKCVPNDAPEQPNAVINIMPPTST